MNEIAKLKLDKKDYKLLLELDRNCRISLKELAAKIKSPIETTRYRILRLEKQNVIKNYLTVIDGGKLGFYYYKVFFRLHNVKEETVQRIISELIAHPKICWVIRTDGNFDIGFTPRVSDVVEQSRLLDQLRSKYSKYLKRFTLSVNVRMDFFARDYLVGNQSRKLTPATYSAQSENLKLDAIAQKVLVLLSENPRESGSVMADKLNCSSETVLSRIRFLEKQKAIIRYSLVTDVEVLGFVNFYVLIYLADLSVERENEFRDFCACQPNIIYLIKSLGEWDYELSVETRTIQEYRDLMMRLTREFSEIIQEYKGMMVQKIEKYIYP